MLTLRAAGAKPSRRGIIKAAGALALGVAAPAPRIGAALAAYPERVVKVVVANTPGGPSDIIARFMAAALQESTGKTFIVESRGGGGGNIGMGAVARADPDGYTLLLATSAYSVNPGLYKSLPYDPLKDSKRRAWRSLYAPTWARSSPQPASRCRPRTARPTWRASPGRCRCSARSSSRPASNNNNAPAFDAPVIVPR
jgi:hypothetical protein